MFKIDPLCNVQSLVFSFVTNATIRDISSIDSKLFHTIVFQSKNITFDSVKISAPGDSPNTDGIHIGDSTNINIVNSVIGTGDDCISLGSGSTNVTISNVFCGPGHGISVGSLGKYANEKDVIGLTVSNCTLTGTTNGLRIKTWQSSSSALVATSFVYEDIIMNNVYNPIIIDQEYCPYISCAGKVYMRLVSSSIIVFSWSYSLVSSFLFFFRVGSFSGQDQECQVQKHQGNICLTRRH
jgi:galacturan 1,4-alpha-galacturonidase